MDQAVTSGALFDSVGFAIEDFSALRYVHSKLADGDFCEDLDLLADPDEPRDLLGMVHRAKANGGAAAAGLNGSVVGP